MSEALARWSGECCVTLHRRLCPGYFEIGVHAPVALAPRAGQFLMVRARGVGYDPLLPRAFSVYDTRPEADGTFMSFMFRVQGRGTRSLAELSLGDPLHVFGPLGTPFAIAGGASYLVAGGIGFPPLMLLADQIEGPVRFFYGARSAEELVGQERLERRGVRPVLCTDDGSRGIAGMVTRPLEAALAARDPGSPACIYGCGPLPLLKALGRIGRCLRVTTRLCFEARMACGAGLCRGCALPRAEGGYLMCCMEGPALDATQVALEEITY